MRQQSTTLTIETSSKGLFEITSRVIDWAEGCGIQEGLLTVFCQHTSASLLIQENAASEVRTDLQAWFERAVPEDPNLYAHDDEGLDDMPAHIRSALTSVQLSIPILGGRPALGMWQGIYLFEHRRRPHRRSIVLHLIGE
jgi:secondary thiamine-phosphate synthase enzyme